MVDTSFGNIFSHVNETQEVYLKSDFNSNHTINMTSFKCQIHDEEPLDMVCLNDKCQHKGLICFICKLDQLL